MRPIVAAVLVCLVALGMRLWYLDEAREEFDFERPVVDAGYHDYWAWGIASGEWKLPLGAHVDPRIASTPYFRPPLTAYWLAALFKLFGHDHLTARIVQLLLGTASCLVVLRLATRLFDLATGVVAGLFAASYWVLVYFDMEYREVSLLVFLYPTLALALLRWREAPSTGRAVLAGVLLGLSALARPNGLLCVPVVLLWGWWATREERPTTALRQAGAFVLAVAACVLPVTARNLVVGGELVLISSNGGINLYIGNNPQATGTAVALPREIPTFDSAFDYPEIVRKVGESEGRALAQSEVSRWFARRALAYAAEHPLRTLGRVGRKAAAFWGGREIVSEKDLVSRRRSSAALGAVPLNISAVIVGAALGLVLWAARRRRDEGVALVLVLVGTYFVSLLPFFVTARFRAPVVPFLMVFAAFALRELYGMARRRRFGALLLSIAALTGGYVLHRPGDVDDSRDVATDLAVQGAQLASAGRLEEAEQLLRRAVAADPANGMARNNLGLLLSHIGQNAEAIEHLRVAIQIDDGDARPHQNLAIALLEVGELQPALEHFGRAAELAPLNPAVHLEAGRALLAKGQPHLAVPRLTRAGHLAPDDPRIREALADALRAAAPEGD